MKKLLLSSLVCLYILPIDAQKKWSETQIDGSSIIKNQDGQTLGYSPHSGIKILTVNGLAFKDLNKNAKLDKYEDWRLPVDVRAKDLASKLSIEQIAGLMRRVKHQTRNLLNTQF